MNTLLHFISKLSIYSLVAFQAWFPKVELIGFEEEEDVVDENAKILIHSLSWS